MKDLLALKEQLALIEKEIKSLAEKLDQIDKKLSLIEDLDLEIKAIKLFLKRNFPDFTREYPEIFKKIRAKE